MAKKAVLLKPKGMNRDLSVSSFNAELSFENRNLRLSTNEGNTMMSWVTEKGTALLTCNILTNPWESETEYEYTNTIAGVPVGTTVLNDTLVLFTTEYSKGKKSTEYYDYIYVLKYTDGAIDGKIIYKGHLNFNSDYPFETMAYFESSEVQKVYWTDDYNQPRLVNINADKEKLKLWNTQYRISHEGVDTFFDFVPDLELKEKVTVEKLVGVNGSFPPGVIQYAFTYYNKYGQESNIFYTTPLYYISYLDRGASPEDTSVENAFRISISNIDRKFDYVRIYSIHRTSINAAPIAKRVQDVPVLNGERNGSKFSWGFVSFVDTGTEGNSIDPTELLYKGGENIHVGTFAQKDNLLFLGNLHIERPYIKESSDDDAWNNFKKKIQISSNNRGIYSSLNFMDNYVYNNQLTSFDWTNDKTNNSVPCGGFKCGETYRLGVQFQYKSGKWSSPIWIGDVDETNYPYQDVQTFSKNGNTNNYVRTLLPTFHGKLDIDTANTLISMGYRKIRALVVFPNVQDRRILCQGVVCPTLFTERQRYINKYLQAQSSWFFRTKTSDKKLVNSNGAVYPSSGSLDYILSMKENDKSPSYLPYAHNSYEYNPDGDYDNGENQSPDIRSVEVEGVYLTENMFQTRYDILTLHSPDIEFEDYLSLSDFLDAKYRQVGNAEATKTFSDINIQTESPTVSNVGSGFVHKSFVSDSMYGITSGLFYDDYIVNDYRDGSIRKFDRQRSSCKWMVYLWNKNGSLNNDIDRPADKGTASAILKKKIVSNLRFCKTTQYNGDTVKDNDFASIPQVFSSEESTIIKLGSDIYMGNIDTMLSPDSPDGMYFGFGSKDNHTVEDYNISTSFTAPVSWKTWSTSMDNAENQGIWKKDYARNWWNYIGGNENAGNEFIDLVLKKSTVRMKYRSTPHMVFKTNDSYRLDSGTHTITWNDDKFPVVEIVRNVVQSFGGMSDDALMDNDWVPCGIPVALDDVTTNPQTNEKAVEFDYSFGDTYYQRWDCLKTYPYTNEDLNQVVEIGSFMLESHINMDGRYDRNRGQVSNINMSPRNFNLFNPVYSQPDNFFTYKILDEGSYKTVDYPNQITWTLAKTNGADVDLWTNITLASTMDLDGDRGSISKLIRFNDQLIAFQDRGISQLLYNENVQISSSQGVPIEIANSGKVQGRRYYSDTVGCSDKWAMAVSPSGIYFMDSYDKGIYLFNGQLKNLSLENGFNAWCKQTMESLTHRWTPLGFDNFVAYYDSINQDILFINKDIALAYSEKTASFTSFYDYGGVPFFVNIDGKGIWIKPDKSSTVLYGHNMGDYCNFFGTSKPYWMTLIANPEPQSSKVFTNIELRATVDGDGINDETKNIFTPSLPFDDIEVWNEYQHGIQSLANKTGKAYMQHYTKDEVSTLKRKFRIWRADIPRDNAPLTSDTGLNISRFKPKPLDRIRNPWIYLKLEKNNPLSRTEIHDIVLTYFN